MSSLQPTSRPIRSVRNQDRLTFRQLFLSSSRRAGTIERDVKQVAAALSDAGAEVDATEFGDPFLLGEEFSLDVAARRRPHLRRQLCEAGFCRRTGTMAGSDPVRASDSTSYLSANGEQRAAYRPSMPSGRRSARQWADARRIEAEQKLYRRCATL